jgi:hypothetical protein
MLRDHRTLLLIGLLIAAAVAVSSTWLASGDPDGLQRVAQEKQFEDRAKAPGYEVLPGYSVPGVDGPASTALAGLIGVGVVAALVTGAGYLLRARRRRDPDASRGP